MIAFKCKICGGNLELEQVAKIATCSSCGSTHSLPNLENDKVRNLFERANQLRLNHEFDKAMGVYETIVTENPTDPETYWSLVLCRYGVEYVEDPKTKKRVMTTHRTLPQSVLRDGDYQQAIKLASIETKRLYQEEANQIDTIQKGILSISNQEDPYDIFICYKETDLQGRRTIDSVLGQKLYEELIEEGFKVFFAKITLEDKLGQEYEPYIYSALTTSKVMLVLGTQSQYFEAPWVRNEWSRFLTMMKAEKKKTLIPLYRDMDAYGLPEEFRIFQSQDLNKVGATQDLIRGLKKLIPLEKTNTPLLQKETTEPKDRNLSTKIKRAMLALEDRDFEAATNFAEEALDVDPESAEAYLVKWLAALEATSIDDVFAITDALELRSFQNNPQAYQDFLDERLDEDNTLYQKIKKFGKKTILPLIEASIQKHKIKILNGVIENIESSLIRGGAIPEVYQRTLNQIEPQLAFIQEHPKGEALYRRFFEAKEEVQIELTIIQARELFEARSDELQDALEPLQLYATNPQVQRVIEELTGKHKQIVKEKEALELKRKKEIYQEIQANLKIEKVKNYQLSLDLIKQIKGYEDTNSLETFALKKIKELRKIQQKKLLKLSLLSIASLIVLSLTSFAVDRFVLSRYQVQFNANGGNPIESDYLNFGQDISEPNNLPYREGHTFVGWYTDSELTKPFTFGSMPANDITVYAKWSINQYTISFQSNGGTNVNPITQDYGTSVSAPTPPTKTGYTFMGWYRDEVFNTGYSFTTMPAESPTLYAKWIVNFVNIEASSYRSSSAISLSGDLYLWGNNEYGQLGDQVSSNKAIPNKLVNQDLNISEIKNFYGTYYTSFIITSSNKLYSFGSNVNGLLGKGNNNFTITNIQPISEVTINSLAPQEFIVRMSTSEQHVLALSNFGNVYAWGRGTEGQLGYGGLDTLSSPAKLSLSMLLQNELVSNISAGSFSSMILTNQGRVFTFGANNNGELGNGTWGGARVTAPTLINLPPLQSGEFLVSIHSSNSNSMLVLTNLGRVIAWGYNGLLGQAVRQLANSNEHIYIFPTDLNLNFGINEKVIQIETFSYSTVILTDQGRIHVRGNNSYVYELGSAANWYELVVNQLYFNEKIIYISAGENQILALSNKGRIFSRGGNSSGQLGDGTTTTRSSFVHIEVR